MIDFDPSILTSKIIRIRLNQCISKNDLFINKGRIAAVLLILFVENDQWKLLLTRRTNKVQEHKGQVAFPGGAFEKGDRTIIETALREAKEEINLNSENVEVLGQLPALESVTKYSIHPVVCVIREKGKLIPNQNEVDRIFSVPLKWLANPNNHREQSWVRSIGNIENVIFYDEYEGEIIWGITARIIQYLINAISCN